MLEKKGTAKKGKKKIQFAYSIPEDGNLDELKMLTGCENQFAFTVASYEKKLQQKANRVAFDHETYNPHTKERKKVKALKGNAITLSLQDVKLVKQKKAPKPLSQDDLRAQMVAQLVAAGRSEEQVEAFMTQWDQNMALAESAAD